MRSTKLLKQLDEYQVEGVRLALSKKTALLYYEQGTGKTWIATAIAEQLQLKVGSDFSGLFIVPLVNKESTWAALFDRVLDSVMVCRDVEEFIAWKKAWATPAILLLHYEEVPPQIKKLKKQRWTLCVYDEAQRLRERGTISSRKAGQLSKCSEYRVVLTGTPLDKSPIELWGQFRFVRPELLGAFKDFENRFMEPLEEIDLSRHRAGSFGRARALKRLMIAKSRRQFDWSKLNEFTALIRPYALRVENTVLDLPDYRIQKHWVQLRGKQRQYHREMEKTWVIEEIGVSAINKAVRNTKLHQICGGFVIDDEDVVHHVGNAKLSRLRYLMRTLPKPLPIFCAYSAEIAEVARLAGPKTAIIEGGVKNHREIVERFQSGALDYLIVQNVAGGVGIDLFTASDLVIYSFRESFITFDQIIARVVRRGQENNVTIHLILAEESFDTQPLKSVMSKSQKTKRVLQPLRKGTSHGR